MKGLNGRGFRVLSGKEQARSTDTRVFKQLNKIVIFEQEKETL